MKLLKNKFFIFGNVALIVLAIPLTLWFVSRQQDLRSKAAPTTTLSFSNISMVGNMCTNPTTILQVNPGQNVLGTVDITINYDPAKINLEITPNSTAFPQILKPPVVSGGIATFQLSTGIDVDKAIRTTTDVATIKIIPLDKTGTVPSEITIDTLKTKVVSVNYESDGLTENVFTAAGSTPAKVAITDEVCTGGTTTPSPSDAATDSGDPTATPTTTTGVATATPTTAIAATATPTTAATNVAPTCTTLTASPSASGTAPFSLTLSGTGTDSDGLVAKATFNFGDGTVQDVTTGMNLASVTTELSHTYTSGGNFSSSLVFTDNSGGISNSCSQLVTITGGTDSATMTPTSGIAATDTPTSTPTIAASGSIGMSLGIFGAILLAVLGGIFLLAL